MPMNNQTLRPKQAIGFASLVSTKSTGNVFGTAHSTTGYIKVTWWDSTINVYGTGNPSPSISWSKAAGGAGSKTIRIVSCSAAGNPRGKLTGLECGINSLTSLNVSGLTALATLYCNDNSLTSLDVSGLTALATLYCYNNSLTSLRAVGVVFDAGFYKKKQPEGIQLIMNNSLNAAALNQFYTDLGATTPGTGFLDVSDNPGNATHNTAIATAKGYLVFASPLI